MTVKELKALLDKCNDNAEVVLPNNQALREANQVYAPFARVGEWAVLLK